MSNEQKKGGNNQAAQTQPSTETKTESQVPATVQQPQPPAKQQTFFNVDLFSGVKVGVMDLTSHRNKAGQLIADGDRFKLMTRKQAAQALELENNKDNRATIDQTIIDEGKVAWRRVKAFLMTLPDEWILKRFVLRKKTNGRTSLSLNIEDLEREIIEMEKAAKAWGVKVEDLADFLAAKKAESAKKAKTATDVPSTVVTE